jgi:hypothetical protein
MCTKLHDERDAMRQAIVYPANTDVFPSLRGQALAACRGLGVSWITPTYATDFCVEEEARYQWPECFA